MRTRILALTTLCAMLAFASSAAMAVSPEDIVKKSGTAEKSVSYKGTKTTTMYVGRRVQARMKVLHQKPGKTRVEYLSPKELSGIITIDDGRDSWRLLPKKGIWEHQKWDLGDQRLSLALKNYKVQSAGSGSIAGRPAHIVKLIPKSSGIPSQTLWIDKRSYLVLKSEVRGPSGSLRSTSSFTDIDLTPGRMDGKIFDPRGPVSEPSRGSLAFNPIKPGYLPSGYVLVGITPLKVNGGISAHLRYTNGINTISIFEKINPRALGSGSGVQKKPNGITIVTRNRGKIAATVIGDIDSGQLLKIADSLK